MHEAILLTYVTRTNVKNFSYIESFYTSLRINSTHYILNTIFYNCKARFFAGLVLIMERLKFPFT